MCNNRCEITPHSAQGPREDKKEDSTEMRTARKFNATLLPLPLSLSGSVHPFRAFPLSSCHGGVPVADFPVNDPSSPAGSLRCSGNIELFVS